ncbi:MAG: C4-dicarboxylate ABC transporter [Candidatus Rokuibacteriota bacterium]|nr:MAG: C4-dicarboxylate ABC transporter [Candidatus Rokubacteria bacterium]
MSDPSLGLTMLGLIVVSIMMGYPTAFTLMGLGAIFGFIAFWDPAHHWWQNRIFDLIAQRTYGVMTNDTLLSVPLFVFMGYIMERAALVDIALRPMLKAGDDIKLASGAITAGGTLGILIPPSVMLIVYAAVAGQSIVKLYAAAMLPGFFLTFLYLVYILGWAIINPRIAPKLPPDQYRVSVPDYLRALERGRSRSVVPGLIAAAFRPVLARSAGYRLIARDLAAIAVPIMLTIGTFTATWWYVVIYNAPEVTTAAVSPATKATAVTAAPVAAPAPARTAPTAAPAEEKPQELGTAAAEQPQELGAGGEAEKPAAHARTDGGPEEMTSLRDPSKDSGAGQIPAHFYAWFWGLGGFSALLLLVYFWRMDGEQLEILKELIASVVPLGVLTAIVLAVILFGICTATESAAVGALGAMYLAVMARYQKAVWWWSLVGFVIGIALGWYEGEDWASLLVAGSIAGTLVGTVVPGLWYLRVSPELRRNMKESTFLTAKTTAMVCWLFVGSALFSAVFALHGGQSLIERWVLSMNLSPLGFQIIAQLIIFLLGWPLEWTEIIVIFCPIFIPLLAHFHIDPILFGTMVAVNLQAAFLSPPVAMSAFYLKGVAPKHVTLNQIFAGMMPYMIIVLICLVFMYVWPGMTLWLPEFLYGK